MDALEKSYFELLGLEERFALDLLALQAAYRSLQSAVHPDRFAAAGPAERRLAMQLAVQVNEAYRTLNDPGRRAAYLCARHGVAVEADRRSEIDRGFLVQQLEWREALEQVRESGDRARLAELHGVLCDHRARLIAELTRAIDAEQDYLRAAAAVRRWLFVAKFGEDVATLEHALPS